MSKNPFDVNFNVTIATHSKSVRATALALMYDAKGACESGGRNRGKIVRAVMDGHEGAAYEWCAGLVTNCYILAARLCQVANPFRKLGQMRWSSSAIFRYALKQDWVLFVDEPQNGDLFLVQGGRTGYKHTGMVARVQKERVVTVEGNVDDQVLIRDRRRTGLVFVHVAD